ncbi:MAG TPA: L,D-transpeptidase [Rhizomicrobium sp.]
MMRLGEFAAVAALAMAAMGAAIGFQDYQSNPALQAQAQNLIPDFARSAVVEPALPQKTIRIATTATFVPLPPPAPAEPDAASGTQAPPPKPIPQIDPATLQADAVAQRVKDSVPAELFAYFHTYLYVSKAADGSWAQHMFVFHRADNGRLVFEETFPVSTGRERSEKYFTTTPTGIFELDPNRFDAHHRSRRWGGAPMPWAMFLNYTTHGHLAGIALHSGIGHVAFLGQRASGGCVRMPPEKAELYFKRFQAEEHGQVPVFGFDALGNHTDTDGHVVRDMTGNPVLTEGYRVLLIIQNYPGGPAMVAELS